LLLPALHRAVLVPQDKLTTAYYQGCSGYKFCKFPLKAQAFSQV
jgi:hypothetical protein